MSRKPYLMSKYIYLLGAGASRGIRDERQLGLNYYVSGVPIVSEIGDYLDKYCSTFYPHYTFGGSRSYNKYPAVYNELTWLRDKCKDNPTLDTYAKKLYVKSEIQELNRLKRALAIFFSVIQSRNRRDMRYDSFMQAVVDERGMMNSSISIFTWNYDRQCEYAFHEFEQFHTSASHQYKYAHIACKGFTSQFIDYNDSNLVKLNGMASFKPVHDQLLFEEDNYTLDTFERMLSSNSCSYMSFISYAWEEDNSFIDKILPLTTDTETLIIIGYSMPVVNRSVDLKVLQGMKNLKSIIIQDTNYDSIKRRLFEILPDTKKRELDGKIVHETDLTSFYIPALV
jgi:hypothetical protein